MNAWLITWEGSLLYKDSREKIVAVLSSRNSEKSIAAFVELFYLRSICNAFDMAYYANRRKAMPFKAQQAVPINGILHGDRVSCGSSSLFLYARKVTNLKISTDKKKRIETLTWIEPPTYKWRDERKREFDIDLKGEIGKCQRNNIEPLDSGVDSSNV